MMDKVSKYQAECVLLPPTEHIVEANSVDDAFAMMPTLGEQWIGYSVKATEYEVEHIARGLWLWRKSLWKVTVKFEPCN